ncbi:MAG: hypothetical protein V7720_11510 [Halioglobus sp.]
MDWLDNQARGAEHPDTIIHLGAGTCRELGIYQSLDPRQIILIEPNPEQLEILHLKAASAKNIQIVECAVSDRGDDNCLQVLSDPHFSSLREPSGLLELIPGLKVERQVTVTTRTITELIDSLGLEAGKNHWLFIDTPGVEAEILQAINESGEIELFSHLLIRAGAESFFAGAIPIRELSADLGELGYRPVGQPDYSDADFPVYHLHLDQLLIEQQRLTKELRADVAEKDLKIDTLSNQIQDLNSNADKLRADVAEKDLKIDTLSNQIQDLNSNADKLRADAAEKDLKIQTLSSQVQNQDSNTEKMREEIHSKESDLSIALKLQMLRESDLEDLQERYSEVVELKDRQTELLTSMKERLNSVAIYLSQIDSAGDPMTERDVTAKLLDAISGNVN